MDVDERHRAVCSIGGLLLPDASGASGAARPPLLMGTAYCVNGQHRILCSCAHVWNNIAKLANCLDPAVYGVAVGFRPSLTNDRARAERGEVDWVGRAVLLSPPGILNPPSFNPPSDGLDLVVLQLTQLLDGSPLPSAFRPFVALPLGDPDSLQSGDELTMMGFGVIGGQVINRGNARPKHPRFSTISQHPSTGRWIETGGQEMAHSGHSGGPLLGPRGEIVGWVVWTVGPSVDGVIVGGVDQLRPVDARFELALSAALDALLPATTSQPLRHRLATGGRTLPLTAGSAGHTAAAAQGAQATADRAQIAAQGAQAALQQVQQAMGYLQTQSLMATKHQLQRNQLERQQLGEQYNFQVDNFQVGSLQLQLGEQAYSWLDFPSQQSTALQCSTAMLPLASDAAMPPLGSPSSSPDSSPGRCSIEDLGLVIDGDYPSFEEEEFKRDLAKLLHLEVSWRDIEVTWKPGSRDTFARVQLGTCEVEVKCNITGGRTIDCSIDERRIKMCVRDAIEEHWPPGVTATLAKPKVKWPGSIILVLELPQPLPVLLMQLAAQHSAKLLEAVPGLLCCQLGDSVVRLEGCKDGNVDALAAAMEHAKRLVVPSDEATRGEPSGAASEACTICGRQRSTCSYRDRQSFEPSIGAIVFAENHFAALGLSVEQAYAQGFASKVESAFRKRSRPVHPDKQQRRLSDLVPSDPEDEPVLPSGQEDKPVLLPVLEDEPAAEQESTLRPLEPAPESEPAPVHPPLTHLRCFNCCGFAPTDSAVSSCGLGVDAAPSGLGVDAAPSANATRSAGRLQEDLCSQRLQIRRTVPCQPLRILRPCRQSGIGRVRPQP